MKRHHLLIPLLALALALAAGCGDDSEDKNNGRVDVEEEGRKITITGKEGKATFTAGGGAEIPDGFPDDVYIYDGAKVNTSATVKGSYQVQLSSSDAVDKVLSVYKQKMEAAGWSEEAAMDMGEHKMLHYKKDGREINVQIIPEDSGATNIIISVPKK